MQATSCFAVITQSAFVFCNCGYNLREMCVMRSRKASGDNFMLFKTKNFSQFAFVGELSTEINDTYVTKVLYL